MCVSLLLSFTVMMITMNRYLSSSCNIPIYLLLLLCHSCKEVTELDVCSNQREANQIFRWLIVSGLDKSPMSF